jgi:hypothetical protein
LWPFPHSTKQVPFLYSSVAQLFYTRGTLNIVEESWRHTNPVLHIVGWGGGGDGCVTFKFHFRSCLSSVCPTKIKKMKTETEQKKINNYLSHYDYNYNERWKFRGTTRWPRRHTGVPWTPVAHHCSTHIGLLTTLKHILYGTAAANGLVRPSPGRHINEYGAVVESYWQEKSEELREKPIPVPICPPQIRLDWPGREPGRRGEKPLMKLTKSKKRNVSWTISALLLTLSTSISAHIDHCCLKHRAIRKSKDALLTRGTLLLANTPMHHLPPYKLRASRSTDKRDLLLWANIFKVELHISVCQNNSSDIILWSGKDRTSHPSG